MLLGLGAAAALMSCAPYPSSAQTESQLRITDDTGAVVTLQIPARRVACLVIQCVDILASLGMTPVAIPSEADDLGLASDPRLLGTKAATLRKIAGTYMEPDVEDVAAARPDLIIGYTDMEGLRPALQSTAPVALFAPVGYEGVIKDVERLGILTGRRMQAAATRSKLLHTLATFSRLSPHSQTALIMWDYQGTIGVSDRTVPSASVVATIAKYPWSAPKGSYQGPASDMYYSLENILKENPDVIFVEKFGPDPKVAQYLATSPLWHQFRAVRTRHVYEVDSEVWHKDQAPIGLIIIVKQAMHLLYPQLAVAR